MVGRATLRIQGGVGKAAITNAVARTLIIVVMGRLFIAIIADFMTNTDVVGTCIQVESFRKLSFG